MFSSLFGARKYKTADGHFDVELLTDLVYGTQSMVNQDDMLVQLMREETENLRNLVI